MAVTQDDLGEPTGPPVHETRRYGWVMLRTALEYLAHNSGPSHALLSRSAPFPAPFKPLRLEGWGGASIKAVAAFHERPAPLVVFVPGTFNTKDTVYTKAKIVALHRDAGVHVVAFDLRGFGDSRLDRSTGGVLEAIDVAMAARALAAEPNVTHVALCGESLGASVCIRAAATADGAVARVLAWSPFADLAWAARWVSTSPPTGHAYRPAYHAFRTLLRRITTEHADRFDAYLQHRAARLGLTLDHLAAAASPRHVIGSIQVPTRIIHAEDDPVVPAFHARVLQVAAAGNPLVDVKVVATGGHALFDVADAAWYKRAIEAFVAPLRGATA